VTNAPCRCPGRHHDHATGQPRPTAHPAAIEGPYADLGTVLSMLPQYIRAARTRRGMSMRDLAAEIGVSVSTIHRIESRPSPFPTWLPAVLQWLNTPIPESGQ
jgi:ribosome-binding protein aMBF1 (putative translation factor)